MSKSLQEQGKQSATLPELGSRADAAAEGQTSNIDRQLHILDRLMGKTPIDNQDVMLL